MSIHTAIGLIALLALSSGCASSGDTASPAGPSRTTARNPNLITVQEITASPAANAYDLIVRLRPQWLRNSGIASIGGGAARQGALVAYLDNVRLPRFDDLRTVAAGGVRSIRYLNAEQAQALDTNLGLVVGAVVVSTK